MKLSKTDYLKARDFILTNARMIERRLFYYLFENDGNEGVYHSIYAYKNKDGGFGHGMEPDTASPESQPLFTIMALEILDEVGYLTKEVILNDFMPYFEKITTQEGGIPWMFRPKSDYPCHDHFKTVRELAALSTTAPLLGMLEKFEIDIPWMKKAEQFVWKEIDRIKEKHVFCYLCVPRRLFYLQHAKNKTKANNAINDLKKWILTNGVLREDTKNTGWGLYEKPHSLNYAPSPKALLNSIFPPQKIDTDLNALIQHQKNDGRWDTWYGLSEGMKLEWAGIQTLYTLKILKAYDRIEF